MHPGHEHLKVHGADAENTRNEQDSKQTSRVDRVQIAPGSTPLFKNLPETKAASA